MYDDWMEVYLKLHILSKCKRKSVRIAVLLSIRYRSLPNRRGLLSMG